jgi:hypothetical protein
MSHPGIHFQHHIAEFFYNLHNQGGYKEWKSIYHI